MQHIRVTDGVCVGLIAQSLHTSLGAIMIRRFVTGYVAYFSPSATLSFVNAKELFRQGRNICNKHFYSMRMPIKHHKKLLVIAFVFREICTIDFTKGYFSSFYFAYYFQQVTVTSQSEDKDNI
jgi:hypothetical protein